MKCDAYAMTKHTVPRKIEGLGAYSPKNDFGKVLSLNARTYSRHEWHGVAGTVNVSTHDSPTTSNTRGSILFMVPTVRSGFTYRDALDIYFENVGSFDGRQLNAQMHFDTIEYGPYTANTHYNISYSSNPTGIFLLKNASNPEMFFGRSDQQEYFPGLEQRYDACKHITFTITVTYADSGEVVNIPFYQYVSDLDDNNRWNSYGSQEGVTFGNGFTDDLYVYDGFRCEMIDRKVQVPNDGRNHNYSDFYNPPPVPGATSGEKSNNDPRVREASYFLNACWGVTTGGRFTVTFHGANAVSEVNFRSPYLNQSMVDLTKTGSQDGDNMYWTINYTLPKLDQDLLAPFHSLVVTDVLPGNQMFVRAEVVNDSGSVLSDVADVSYDSGSRRLTVAFRSGFLSNRSNYGKTWSVRIYCNWAGDSHVAENQATITINEGKPEETPKIQYSDAYRAGVGVYKYVIDPQESYGPGDLVTFAVVIDHGSYMARQVKYSEYSKWSPRDPFIEPYIYNFQFEDLIPEGLALEGDVKCYSYEDWDYQSSVRLKKYSGTDYVVERRNIDSGYPYQDGSSKVRTFFFIKRS